MSSQREIAYQKIKDMIFHMELLPGTRVTESQIAAQLSISRTPIHDALRSLEAEGFVTIEPNRGATVTRFTDAETREIGTIRLIQDILSAQLAAYYGSAADFDRLNQMAEVCEETAAKGDVYGRIRTDIEFHLEIANISRNTRLIRQQQAIYQQIHLIQISQYVDISRSLSQIHHHRPIIAAIRNNDQAQLRLLICEHSKDFYKLDPYILKCYAYTEPQRTDEKISAPSAEKV